MVFQYSRSSITKFLNHCQDWCPFHTSPYSEASLLYLILELQIGARTAGALSSFTSHFPRQHTPNSIPDFTELSGVKITLNWAQAAVESHTVATNCISSLQKAKDFWVFHMYLDIYLLTDTDIFPCPSCKSSAPLEEEWISELLFLMHWSNWYYGSE